MILRKASKINQMNNDTENVGKGELFKRAISDVLAARISKIEEELKDTELPSISNRHSFKHSRK